MNAAERNQQHRIPYNNIVDADGHILEPPDIWEKYIDPQYRDKTICVRVDKDGKEYLGSKAIPPGFSISRRLPCWAVWEKPPSKWRRK